MSGSGSSLRQLWQLVRLARPSRAALGAAALAATLSAAATLYFPLLAKRMVDELGGGRLEPASIAAMAAVLVAAAIASAVSSYLLARTGHGLVAGLRRLLVGKLLKMPVPAFDEDSTGARVSRVLSDCDSISELATRQSVNLLTGIMLLSGSVVVLLLLDVQLTLTLFACLAVAFAIVIPLAQLLEGLARGTQDRTARLAGILAHVFSEIRLVKAFTAEAREQERAGREIEEIRRLGLRTARINAGLEPIIGLALTAALLVILMYGSLRVSSGAIGMGTLTAFLLYIFNVAAPLIQLTNFTAELQKAKGASARIAVLLNEAEEGSLAGLAQESRPGELAFRGVSFAYPGREERVLQHIDLVFRPGTTTALVGTSGSGKTTILSLIERFYAPGAGEIVYDGRPIASLPLAAWRGRIGYVAQGAPIMPGTVRDNITYGLAGDYPDEMVLAAAARAGALAFIEQMPQGLDTSLIEQGNNLSGGQRQRIAIARMFLRNPDILILDEATSNLDSETEYQVREALEALMAGRTNIVVAHRLATVVHADRIYFLEDGRISGVGRHKELLGSHPYYARLVAHQMQPALAAQHG
ncbi:ABC transporter ATP-binding protein [Massilia sp. erpn]|uniref:ABC transporter ATP-binding protein n=1 Tax=Massilia sp. erpn TaxID=2738142 RepID=UPI0021062377|nr:ABC transporter ATP-binding protein [Massilia sp. erpn]UTY59644.1 ABC transporter ATP-binding protein [Massilia sp. erpn]